MKPTDFGVQSYCFRNFAENREVARMVRELGLDKVEICGVHADFSDPAGFREVVATYEDAGVRIISIGVQTCEGRPEEERWFECAASAGARHMSIHLKVESHRMALPWLRVWSRQYGVRLGLHNHGGYLFGGSPDVVGHLLELGGPELGLCLDTAWVMQLGPAHGDPVRWAKDFAGRISGVHYKDFVFQPDGQWQDAVVGEGNLRLPEFVGALEAGGFDGMAVIEYEADIDNPVPALGHCVKKLRELGGS